MHTEFAVPDHKLSEQNYVKYLNSLIPDKYNYNIEDDSDKDLSNRTLLYATSEGNVFSAEVDIDAGETKTWNRILREMEEYDEERDMQDMPVDYYDIPKEPTIDRNLRDNRYTFLDEWQEVTRLSVGMFINPKEQIIDILKKKIPYVVDMAKKVQNPGVFLLEPELEQLKKAGYAIADTALNNTLNERDIDIFHSFIQKGSDIRSIFTIPAKMYKNLKNEPDLLTWESFDIIAARLTNEEMQKIIHERINENELYLINQLLNRISLDKLLNYTKRVMRDHPEDYRNRQQCLRELIDTLNMSEQLEISYNFKRYNLHKQHNKLAKLVREQENKDLEDGFKNTYNIWKPFEKKNKKFIIRPVKTQKELNDEASQQDNCAASYAEKISKGADGGAA